MTDARQEGRRRGINNGVSRATRLRCRKQVQKKDGNRGRAKDTNNDKEMRHKQMKMMKNPACGFPLRCVRECVELQLT